MTTALPERTPRISEDQMQEIVRLDIRRVPHSTIAHQLGVSRRTVERTLERTKSALRINYNLEAEREQALATYREIVRVSWATIEEIDNPARRVGLLSEIRQSQRMIDGILDLTVKQGEVEDQYSELIAAVAALIQDEAPALIPKLHQVLSTS